MLRRENLTGRGVPLRPVAPAGAALAAAAWPSRRAPARGALRLQARAGGMPGSGGGLRWPGGGVGPRRARDWVMTARPCAADELNRCGCAQRLVPRDDLDAAVAECVAQLQAILDAGPMASNVSRVKGAKLAGREFSVQSAIADVLKNTRLTTAAARQKGLASPLLDGCEALYGEAVAMGGDPTDMAGVIHAIAARTDSGRR